MCDVRAWPAAPRAAAPRPEGPPRSGPWRKDDQHNPACRARGAPSRGIAPGDPCPGCRPGRGAAAAGLPGAGRAHDGEARRHPRVPRARQLLRARLGDGEVRVDRQAAAGRRAAAEGADGLQDRQHARRGRGLRRRDAPRDRRPARGLEQYRRPDPGLGRHRHRHVRVPDAHRAAVHGRAGGSRAAAEPREELGLVGGWQRADHAPDRGRQVVGRRPVRRRGHHVLLGRPRDGPGADAAKRRLARNLRHRHEAREGRRLHGEVHLHPGLPRVGALRARLRHLLPAAEPRDEAAASEVLG